MPDRQDLADLFAERPDLAEGIEAVLAVDDDAEAWTFDDVPVDTGVFGEIVARDVVEEVEDGRYRLTDPEAVREALAGETGGEREGGTGGVSLAVPDFEGVDLRARGVRVAAVLGFLAVFVLPRTETASTVFREGAVVLTSNDPYFYRYWVDRALAHGRSPLALDTLWSPPVAEGTNEPLYVATMWWVSALFGGSPSAAGTVLAVYPVVAALCVGALTYVLGTRVLGDRRVGVLAAGSLAVMPVHAMRTGVGFADHHAFDYVWLTATVVVLGWLAGVDDSRGRAARRGAVALGVAVAGHVFAWEAAPLLLVPVAGYLAGSVLLDVEAGRSPLEANAPVVLGLGLAAALAVGGHLLVGWQEPVVVLVPVLLAAGGLALTGGCTVLARRGVSARTVAGLEAGAVLAGVLTLIAGGAAVGGVLDRFAFLLTGTGAGETSSAFGPARLGGLELFGFTAVLALPGLCWAGFRAVLGDRRLLALGVYGWFLLVLSAFQLRFASQAAPLVALFAAAGVVWWLGRTGSVAPSPLFGGDSPEGDADTQSDDARSGGVQSGDARSGGERPPTAGSFAFDAGAMTPGSWVIALLLVGALVGPSVAFLPEQVSDASHEEGAYETALWVAGYADREGLTYPDSYVLSRWGPNRMYNYHVNGMAENYTFAQEQYPRFITRPDPDPMYESLRDRVGFVVIGPLPPRNNTAQRHLSATYGSRWEENGRLRYEAVEHYRAVFATENARYKVFRLVEGARVVGRTDPNATVELETPIDIPNQGPTYRTETTADAAGNYRVTVPYPGEYDVSAANETRTVTVPERAVENGTRVTVGE